MQSSRRSETPTSYRYTISGLFHSPPGVLFTFPSRYWFTIDHLIYLALEGGPPRFKPDFTCPTLLRNILLSKIYFTYATITLYGGPFQVPSVIKIRKILESYNPPTYAGVWAVPSSLVTTKGISIDFFSAGT